MKFLCEKHRHWLSQAPLKAQQVWHRTTQDARDAVRQENWKAAITNYGNALDISDLLMECQHYSEQSVERFAYTALEMSYTLQVNGLPIDWLQQKAAKRLEGHLSTTLTQELLNALLVMETKSNVVPLMSAQHPITDTGRRTSYLH